MYISLHLPHFPVLNLISSTDIPKELPDGWNLSATYNGNTIKLSGAGVKKKEKAKNKRNSLSHSYNKLNTCQLFLLAIKICKALIPRSIFWPKNFCWKKFVQRNNLNDKFRKKGALFYYSQVKTKKQTKFRFTTTCAHFSNLS